MRRSTTTRRATVWVTPLVMVLLGLAGCSSGPSAGEWATTVCEALGPWRQAIVDLNDRAADQMANATTVEQTRQSLAELLGGARDATETARAAVAAAGVADVSGGAAAAEGFEAALARTRDGYAAAQEQLLGLPDDEAAFYDGVARLLAQLTAAYEAAGTEIAGLSSPELRSALDAVPACQ
jgi:hypothetical protein